MSPLRLSDPILAVLFIGHKDYSINDIQKLVSSSKGLLEA